MAIAGRLTPLIRPMRSSADAIVAPVLPAETMRRRLAVAHRLGGPHERRVLLAAHALGRVLVHGDDLGGLDAAAGRRDVAEAVGGPTSTTGMPSSSAARCGAGDDLARRRSPPMASTAIGKHQAVDRSADVDGDAVLVPAAGGAHRVRAAWRRRTAGTALRAGASSCHAPARWLRVFDFDFFFLGTAIVGILSWNSSGRAAAPGDAARP